MEHLESNNILYEMQHGFRSNRSCESQIISLAHQLAQNNDKNIQTDLIIMDFAKAFDCATQKTHLQAKILWYIWPNNKLDNIFSCK